MIGMFKFWKTTKERKIAKLASELVKVMNDLGRETALGGRAGIINIWEYSHVKDLLEINDGSGNKICIQFTHKGKIIK